MKSKLFTPKLRAAQGTPIERDEHARIFVNPPHHPETPVFEATASGGGAVYPLSLEGSGKGSSKPLKRRSVKSEPQERNDY